VNMNGVRLGNAVIDGEVVGNQWRIALDSGHDDVEPSCYRVLLRLRRFTSSASNSGVRRQNQKLLFNVLSPVSREPRNSAGILSRPPRNHISSACAGQCTNLTQGGPSAYFLCE
jgi:hypothetical protein